MIIELQKECLMDTERVNQNIQLKPVTSQDALALSYAAYRTNGNEYIKETRRYSTEGNNPIYSNKELIKFTLAFQRNEWTPDDFTPLKVIPEDYISVEDCRSHFKRYTMLALGDINDF